MLYVMTRILNEILMILPRVKVDLSQSQALASLASGGERNARYLRLVR
eukprot:COSAG06_NODE_44850_length_359_cov_607.053846_2_plen_48_part_00